LKTKLDVHLLDLAFQHLVVLREAMQEPEGRVHKVSVLAYTDQGLFLYLGLLKEDLVLLLQLLVELLLPLKLLLKVQREIRLLEQPKLLLQFCTFLLGSTEDLQLVL